MDIRGSVASSATREVRAHLSYRKSCFRKKCFQTYVYFKAYNTAI